MTKKALKPKLIVIAGPNGSGRTTFTNQVLRHDWSAGCVFINPDEIARHDFGDWNSPDAVMKAVARAQDLREACLRERRSMLIETVFSAPDKLDFIRRVKEADFFIRFFFYRYRRSAHQCRPCYQTGHGRRARCAYFQNHFPLQPLYR